ncbi:MAG TPA: methyltransferase domain-containing protein [Caulobacteraceae bacterium]|nr:methyltransferase domain-containing protein [Caulobacteraceae bacterium]
MSEALRYYEVVEALHTIQNPMSPQKLDRLIEYLAIADGDRVVDVGSGKGWLLRRIAERAKVRATGLELSSVFAGEARRALAGAPLKGAVEIIEGPAADFPAADGGFDVALCIGATFALGDLEGTLAWMARVVPTGGRVAVGEPYARAPFPPAVRARWPQHDRTLAEFVDRFAEHGFAVTGVIASSDDDWDHYESPHWRAGLAWAKAHPDQPNAASILARTAEHRRIYLAEERDVFGWAIVSAERLGEAP